MKLIQIIAAATLSFSASAQAKATQIETIYQYMKRNIEFKHADTEVHRELPSGVWTDFYRTSTVAGVVRADDELRYQLIFNIKQVLRDRLADGTWATEGKTVDRVGMMNCAVSERKSTGEATGACVVGGNSYSHSSGAQSLRMKLADGKLTLTEQSNLYGDYWAPGDTYYTGASRNVTTYSKNTDGKLVIEQTENVWHVNPETLERTSDITTTVNDPIVVE